MAAATRALGPLGRRLAAAFVAVALIVLGSYAALTLAVEQGDVSSLANTQQDQTVTALVSAAGNAYQATGGWGGADLQPVESLAKLSGMAVRLSSLDGHLLLDATPSSPMPADTSRTVRDVVVNGSTVGQVEVTFPAGGLTPAETRLRRALRDAALIGVGPAVAVAAAAAWVVSRALVRPIRRLSTAAAAIGGGDRRVRVGSQAGPGELAELGSVLDEMVTALSDAEASREAMLADIAHELRTPLAVLQAETEALVDGVRPATTEALASLHDEAIRLGRIVDDLQALASAEGAGPRLERRRVDLAAVAKSTAGLLAGRFDDAGVTLQQTLRSAFVEGDEHRLQQVVMNLLANACKFSPPGSVVRLDVGDGDGDGDTVVLAVTDEGPGVAVGERERIFERFYRGAEGRRRSGTGVGLAVVDQLVRGHGGRVRLESPAEGGARFVVELPGAG